MPNKQYAIKWLKLALLDMEEIIAYISLEHPEKAQEVAQEIWNSSQRLSFFPARAKPGRVPGTRELTLTNLPFFLAFRVTGRTVQILRVIHTSRKWPPAADD
jgi:plasmid stabilization system protein ParE